ncbi:MAG: Holliday junction DNA helicase RuvA [Cellvibrionaceae bacterium]|jgi:Holliday junction DNA helicase RuvA
MIGRLKGIIIEKQAPHLLVEVAGVAYEMQASMMSFYPLPAEGKEVVLHTHLSISENAHQLFAFYTQEERQLFRMLIKVSGVGPKMALAILSGMPVAEFVDCVRADNVIALVKVPGVGRKTAERLIIEVKDKLKDWQGNQRSEASAAGDVASSSSLAAMAADAESALIALGYKPVEAAKVIHAVQRSAVPSNSEELIRLALKSLAG